MAKKKLAAPATATPRKIALLGTATTSVRDAPYDDPSWEIWNISGNFQSGKRYDLWFEMHSPEVLEAANTIPTYLEFLKTIGNKLIVGHPSAIWPQAQKYPLESIVNRFGDYFTSTLSYMLAYALKLHLEALAEGKPGLAEIGLWGCDMAVEGEYKHQRPCVEYYLGMARGLDIPLRIAAESPLLRCPAKYAFDYLKLSREMTSRLLEAKAMADKLRIDTLEVEKKYQYALGIRDATKSICEYWSL